MIDLSLDMDLKIHAGPYEHYRVIGYDDRRDKWEVMSDFRKLKRSHHLLTSRELAELLHKAWRFEEEIK